MTPTKVEVAPDSVAAVPAANGVLVPPVPSMQRVIAVDSVRPPELIDDVVAAAAMKAGLSVRDMVIRGFLAGEDVPSAVEIG